ncbi:unnamed protein product, partial [Urochloa humidicola]
MAATGEGSSSSLGSTKLVLARPVDLELARRPLSPSPSTSTTMDPREYLRFLPPHPAPPIQLFAACSSSFRLLPGSDLTRSFLDLLPANRPRPCLDRSLLAANHVNKLRTAVRAHLAAASLVGTEINLDAACGCCASRCRWPRALDLPVPCLSVHLAAGRCDVREQTMELIPARLSMPSCHLACLSMPSCTTGRRPFLCLLQDNDASMMPVQ